MDKILNLRLGPWDDGVQGGGAFITSLFMGAPTSLLLKASAGLFVGSLMGLAAKSLWGAAPAVSRRMAGVLAKPLPKGLSPLLMRLGSQSCRFGPPPQRHGTCRALLTSRCFVIDVSTRRYNDAPGQLLDGPVQRDLKTPETCAC